MAASARTGAAGTGRSSGQGLAGAGTTGSREGVAGAGDVGRAGHAGGAPGSRDAAGVGGAAGAAGRGGLARPGVTARTPVSLQGCTPRAAPGRGRAVHSMPGVARWVWTGPAEGRIPVSEYLKPG